MNDITDLVNWIFDDNPEVSEHFVTIKDFTESVAEEIPMVGQIISLMKKGKTVREQWVYLNYVDFFRNLRKHKLGQQDKDRFQKKISSRQEMNRKMMALLNAIETETQEEKSKIYVNIFVSMCRNKALRTSKEFF